MAPDPEIPPCHIAPAGWLVIATLNLPWKEAIGPECQLYIADDLPLALLGGEDDAALGPRLEVAMTTLYASELFFDLLSGEGDYSPEDLDDHYAVMERRSEEARTLMHAWAQEASPALGSPLLSADRDTVRWDLPQLSVALRVTQEDKELPVEVQLILTPPADDRLGPTV
ncbi:hypothetical protein ACFOME_09630 [Deinococcus metalli]|uniref:hypothetical protein n=1 Tax=Deinococcus metalli TaxID=1141878 RepID=UPI0036149613